MYTGRFLVTALLAHPCFTAGLVAESNHLDNRLDEEGQLAKRDDMSAYPYTTSYWTSTISGKPTVLSSIGTSYSTVAITSSFTSEGGGEIVIGPGFFSDPDSSSPGPTSQVPTISSTSTAPISQSIGSHDTTIPTSLSASTSPTSTVDASPSTSVSSAVETFSMSSSGSVPSMNTAVDSSSSSVRSTNEVASTPSSPDVSSTEPSSKTGGNSFSSASLSNGVTSTLASLDASSTSPSFNTGGNPSSSGSSTKGVQSTPGSHDATSTSPSPKTSGNPSSSGSSTNAAAKTTGSIGTASAEQFPTSGTNGPSSAISSASKAASILESARRTSSSLQPYGSGVKSASKSTLNTLVSHSISVSSPVLRSDFVGASNSAVSSIGSSASKASPPFILSNSVTSSHALTTITMATGTSSPSTSSTPAKSYPVSNTNSKHSIFSMSSWISSGTKLWSTKNVSPSRIAGSSEGLKATSAGVSSHIAPESSVGSTMKTSAQHRDRSVSNVQSSASTNPALSAASSRANTGALPVNPSRFLSSSILGSSRGTTKSSMVSSAKARSFSTPRGLISSGTILSNKTGASSPSSARSSTISSASGHTFRDFTRTGVTLSGHSGSRPWETRKPISPSSPHDSSKLLNDTSSRMASRNTFAPSQKLTSKPPGRQSSLSSVTFVSSRQPLHVTSSIGTAATSSASSKGKNSQKSSSRYSVSKSSTPRVESASTNASQSRSASLTNAHSVAMNTGTFGSMLSSSYLQSARLSSSNKIESAFSVLSQYTPASASNHSKGIASSKHNSFRHQSSLTILKKSSTSMITSRIASTEHAKASLPASAATMPNEVSSRKLASNTQVSQRVNQTITASCTSLRNLESRPIPEISKATQFDSARTASNRRAPSADTTGLSKVGTEVKSSSIFSSSMTQNTQSGITKTSRSRSPTQLSSIDVVGSSFGRQPTNGDSITSFRSTVYPTSRVNETSSLKSRIRSVMPTESSHGSYHSDRTTVSARLTQDVSSTHSDSASGSMIITPSSTSSALKPKKGFSEHPSALTRATAATEIGSLIRATVDNSKPSHTNSIHRSGDRPKTLISAQSIRRSSESAIQQYMTSTMGSSSSEPFPPLISIHTTAFPSSNSGSGYSVPFTQIETSDASSTRLLVVTGSTSGSSLVAPFSETSVGSPSTTSNRLGVSNVITSEWRSAPLTASHLSVYVSGGSKQDVGTPFQPTTPTAAGLDNNPSKPANTIPSGDSSSLSSLSETGVSHTRVTVDTATSTASSLLASIRTSSVASTTTLVTDGIFTTAQSPRETTHETERASEGATNSSGHTAREDGNEPYTSPMIASTLTTLSGGTTTTKLTQETTARHSISTEGTGRGQATHPTTMSVSSTSTLSFESAKPPTTTSQKVNTDSISAFTSFSTFETTLVTPQTILSSGKPITVTESAVVVTVTATCSTESAPATSQAIFSRKLGSESGVPSLTTFETNVLTPRTYLSGGQFVTVTTAVATTVTETRSSGASDSASANFVTTHVTTPVTTPVTSEGERTLTQTEAYTSTSNDQSMPIAGTATESYGIRTRTPSFERPYTQRSGDGSVSVPTTEALIASRVSESSTYSEESTNMSLVSSSRQISTSSSGAAFAASSPTLAGLGTGTVSVSLIGVSSSPASTSKVASTQGNGSGPPPTVNSASRQAGSSRLVLLTPFVLAVFL